MNNHYAPPQSDLTAESSSGDISNNALASLGSTKPWVLFIGIVMIILSVFFILSLISTILSTLGQLNEMSAVPTEVRKLQIISMTMNVVIGVSFMLMGIYLIKYSSSIGRLLVSREVRYLEASLVVQKKFWKLSGILTLLTLIMVVILIVFVASNVNRFI